MKSAGLLKRSLAADTLLFMIANSYLLYTIRQETNKHPSQRVPTFW